jgi:carbon starvation protein
VLIGAVHDFAVLTASVRHAGRSIIEIAREHLGIGAGRALLTFVWVALVYVIVAFADITAGTFVAGAPELEGRTVTFHPGGAVAAASTGYLLLAVLLGVVQRLLRPPLWLVTVIFVPATFGVAWLGTEMSHLLRFEPRTWGIAILVYCGIASILPVWSLLQPRGYLGGFVLYSALAIGVLGVFFGGYDVRQPAFKAWDAGGMTGLLFPFLFVTIACGACSGFHGLVCSGTTSKQIDRESHLKPIGYGAMLAEGFVALIALVTIMIVADADARGLPAGTIYGNGIGRFLTLVLGADKLEFAVTFGAMAFSTFVFDTLDVCTRLGRYIVQELFGWRGRGGAGAATLITMSLPAFLVMGMKPGDWVKLWTLFGASNQLLAALSLLALTMWLRQEGKRFDFALLPMVFVMTITAWALGRLAIVNLRATNGIDVALVNGVAAIALLALALFLGLTAARQWGRSGAPAGSPAGARP